MPVTIAARALRVISLACLAGTPAAAQGIEPPDAAVVAERLVQFNARIPGSILALNPFHNDVDAPLPDGGNVRLVSLNAHQNSWFLLEITDAGGRTRTYHIENADAADWLLSLTDDGALALTGPDNAFDCAPWEDGTLSEAVASGLPFAPICDWHLFVRNEVSGNRSSREAVAQFLRDNVLFGDGIVNLIKGAFYEDAFLVSSEDEEAEDPGVIVALLGRADLDRRPLMRPATGLPLVGTDAGAMEAGAWYAVEDAPGIYASVIQPGQISDAILSRSGEAAWLDGVESRADVMLVAFDLTEFELGYQLGTDHPRVNWSPRPSDRAGGGGPDGFSTISPLVATGMVSPALTDRVAATFTGGFKREHAAWRFGPMAQYNFGHHYGFMQNGVMLSRLWPGLATLYVLEDGTVGMRTWTDSDTEELLPHLVFARQNGVPLIDGGVPGEFVTSWGGGNWSGSAEAELRTVRSGACFRRVGDREFLIYAYFSSATPSAQARTFQAYGCEYAMIL
ncbi:MAG: hypothetical protein AAF914_06110, partial [Pseudomonadota bacterium]